jgi:hypothetical protein
MLSFEAEQHSTMNQELLVVNIAQEGIADRIQSLLRYALL